MKRYRSYVFTGQDPLVHDVIDAIGLNKANCSISDISERSDVSYSTLRNWRRRKTKRPQAATLNAALHAHGKRLTITNLPPGPRK